MSFSRRPTGRHWPKGPHQKSPWSEIFGGIDRVLRVTEPLFPKSVRKRSIDKAVAFVTERLNGEDGLGAIFPAMVNALLVYDALGYSTITPIITARGSIEKLLTIKDDEAYCQPCLSPVWDTALSAHALIEVGGDEAEAFGPRARVAETPAGARHRRRLGRDATEYSSGRLGIPVCKSSLSRYRRYRGRGHGDGPRPRPSPAAPIYREAIARGREWIVGMQSKNGGWGAFDADNTYEYLNQIPFSDHGALLDPPTADVTARCISMLAQLGDARPKLRARQSHRLSERTQEKDGSWYGRWGMNYIYGTWSVLCALNAAGVDPASSVVRKAVSWLLAIQNDDGGWGEDGESYSLDYKGYEQAPSTASQTAWALIGLMAAGEIENPAVESGIAYLGHQGSDGFWNEKRFTATGFPRVFYLRYHGYAKFFPMWAFARYRNLKASNIKAVLVGM